MSRILIKAAVRHLDAGHVIAYPTEAVWGLGCDPWNETAVRRLLQIKKRPMEKGMILIAGSCDQIAALLEPLDSRQRALLEDTWPGPVTWLLPDPGDRVPGWVKGDHSAVAVRVSDHKLVRQLCRDFGGPLVSTSANLAGLPPARSRLQVMKQLGARVDHVLPGPLGGLARPSTIRDLVTGDVLRR